MQGGGRGSSVRALNSRRDKVSDNVLVLPSGSSVSRALRGYAEQVILL